MTVKKSDITIFKPDSEKSLKTWKRRSGYVDTPKARYKVRSPDIFGVMWCMDLVYTSQRDLLQVGQSCTVRTSGG